MNPFKTIYRYELKKLLKRKLVWITFSVCIAFIIVMVVIQMTGSYYVEGKLMGRQYDLFLVDREYQRALSGREIDQELLEEAVMAYRKIPSTTMHYMLTEEYQTYARPYSAIFYLIQAWTRSSATSWEPDEKTFYAARTKRLETSWQELFLSETEKEFWRKKEAQLHTPLTYYSHKGYLMSLEAIATIGVLMLMLVSICLSSVFAEEHSRKTDQLVLSSAKGKSTVYWSKLLAGITVAVACSVLMAVLTVASLLLLYGSEGFQTPLQLEFHTYSYPLTIGQACLIVYGMLIITAILMSVSVMVLSEALHSGIAAMAITMGFIIAGGIISIPDQYRVIAQLWDCLPISFLATWNIFSVRPITILGHCATSWQFVPIVYLLCSVMIAVAGKRVFERYQVTGR